MKKNYTSFITNPLALLGVLLLMFFSVDGFGQAAIDCGTINIAPDAVCADNSNYELFNLFTPKPTDETGTWEYNDGTDHTITGSTFDFSSLNLTANKYIVFKYTGASSTSCAAQSTTVEVIKNGITGTIRSSNSICTPPAKKFEITPSFFYPNNGGTNPTPTKGGVWTHNYGTSNTGIDNTGTKFDLDAFVAAPPLSQNNTDTGTITFTYTHCGFNKTTTLTINRTPNAGTPIKKIYCTDQIVANPFYHDLGTGLTGDYNTAGKEDPDSFGEWFKGTSSLGSSTTKWKKEINIHGYEVKEHEFLYVPIPASVCSAETKVSLKIVRELDFTGAKVTLLKERDVIPEVYKENLEMCAENVQDPNQYRPKIKISQAAANKLITTDSPLLISYTITDPTDLTKVINFKDEVVNDPDNTTGIKFNAGVVILDPYATPTNTTENTALTTGFSAAGIYTVTITEIKYKEPTDRVCTWKTTVTSPNKIITGTFEIIKLELSKIPSDKILISSVCSGAPVVCTIDPNFTDSPFKTGANRYKFYYNYYYHASTIATNEPKESNIGFGTGTTPATSTFVVPDPATPNAIVPVKEKSQYLKLEFYQIKDNIVGCVSPQDGPDPKRNEYFVVVKTPDATGLTITPKPACVGEEISLPFEQKPKELLKAGEITAVAYKLKYDLTLKNSAATSITNGEQSFSGSPALVIPADKLATAGEYSIEIKEIISNSYPFDNTAGTIIDINEIPINIPACPATNIPAAPNVIFYVYPPIKIPDAVATLTPAELCLTARATPDYTVTLTSPAGSTTPISGLFDVALDNSAAGTEDGATGYKLRYEIFKVTEAGEETTNVKSDWIAATLNRTAGSENLSFKAPLLASSPAIIRGKYKIKVTAIDYLFDGDVLDGVVKTTCTTKHVLPTAPTTTITFKEPTLAAATLIPTVICFPRKVDFILTLAAGDFDKSDIANNTLYTIDYKITNAATITPIIGTATGTSSASGLVFNFSKADVPNGENYALTITNISSATACDTATGTIYVAHTPTFSIADPQITGASVSSTEICANNKSTITIAGTVSGVKEKATVVYSLEDGNNLSKDYTTTAVTATTATVVFDTETLANAGTYNIKIKSITETGCIVVFTEPDLTALTGTLTVKANPVIPKFSPTTAPFCAVNNNQVSDLNSYLGSTSELKENEKIDWYQNGSETVLKPEDILINYSAYYTIKKNTITECTSKSNDISVIIRTIAPPQLEEKDEFQGPPYHYPIPFCIKKTADAPQSEVSVVNLTEKIKDDAYKPSLRWFFEEDGTDLIITKKSTELTALDYLADEEVVKNGSLYYAIYYGNVSENYCPSAPLIVQPLLTAGCSEAQVEDNLLIPDAVSPNGDGINDLFIIEGLREEYPEFTMEIYNRFGKLIYSTNIDKPDWNGKASESMGGGTVPSGVYFFVINYNKEGRVPRQGTVYVKTD